VRVLIVGECRPENVFRFLDPSEFLEAEFEPEVIRALCCAFPDYLCGVFRGCFLLEGVRCKSDLALIHKSLSHWFVIEVELVAHSLQSHVLPQVRCFRFGEPEEACVKSLCRAFPQLDVGQAKSLLRYIPRSVAVVANRFDPTWEIALRGLDVQLLIVSVFKDIGGGTAREIHGRLQVTRESVGFAKYSAIDRSLRLSKSCGLAVGDIRVEDPRGVAAIWTVREGNNTLWITKRSGDPGLPHDEYIQILRTFDGRITLKLPCA
jgi:hypothetical protein